MLGFVCVDQKLQTRQNKIKTMSSEYYFRVSSRFTLCLCFTLLGRDGKKALQISQPVKTERTPEQIEGQIRQLEKTIRDEEKL